MKSRAFFGGLLVAGLCLCQQTDPWPAEALMAPASLASTLQSANAKPPVIISVVFPVLYHAKHIQHALFAGPGSKPEGIELLKKTVAGMPKDADIIIYCGCCPMDHCPNLRPAYRALKELGYTKVRVLNIATNMNTDWYTKNYPSETASASETPAAHEPAAVAMELTPAEKQFQESMTNVTLTGFFTVGDEQEAKEDRYTIGKVMKVKEDTWSFDASIQYNKREFKATVLVPVKWAGDTPVMTLSNYLIKGHGVFSARILVYNGMYAGTWGAQSHGGKMFGKIVKNETAPASATP